MLKVQTKCRVCGGRNLITYLTLGTQPLANGLLDAVDQEHKLYPLSVMLCMFCGLSQLTHVVPPEELYTDYCYRTGISDTFKTACRQMIKQKVNNVFAEDLWLDIGCNDGTLLIEAEALLKCRVLGVEPSLAADVGLNFEIPVYNGYWDSEAVKFVLDHAGEAKLVTAQNVLAHVDDLDAFLDGVSSVLRDDGTFMFEVPYARRLIEQDQFDTVYHEHLSYFLVGPLERILTRHDLHIYQIDELSLHGGSLRVWCDRYGNSVAKDWASKETADGFLNLNTYAKFAGRVYHLRDELIDTVSAVKPVVGIGAAAKATVLCNFCGFTPEDVAYIVDDTPTKQGKFQPGSGIPILSRKALWESNPDYVMIFPWNFTEEIMQKFPGYNYIIPNPLRVVKQEAVAV